MRCFLGRNSYIDQELHGAIQDLLDEDLLEEGSKAHGIALFACDNGYDALTAAQKGVFDRFVVPALKLRKQQLDHQRIISSNPE